MIGANVADPARQHDRFVITAQLFAVVAVHFFFISTEVAIQCRTTKFVVKRRAAQRPTPQRVYVKVTSEFDATGYMQPRAITWADGRTFAIDAVRDFRPAGTLGCDCRGDCYTVVIRGEEKHLFFERVDPLFSGRVGRWFVEKTV